MGFKDYIENSKRVTVWHASPTSNIYKLKPTGRNSGVQAVKQGQAGIYVAPSFMDSVKWWMTYVSGTKTKKLRKIGGYPKSDEADAKFSYNYDIATIYEIEIPKKILDKCWFSNDWEKEYFIPEEYIPHLKIISSKKYHTNDLSKIYKKNERKKMDDLGSRELSKMQEASKSNEAIRLYFYFKDKLNNFLLKGKRSSDSILVANINKLISRLYSIGIVPLTLSSSIFRREYKTKFTSEEQDEINRIKNYLNSILN